METSTRSTPDPVASKTARVARSAWLAQFVVAGCVVGNLISSPCIAQQLDIVLQGGLVIDPESGLDAVRNVGIQGDRIVRVTTDKLEGKRVINASGLVVAPGFIDLHQHQQDDESYRLKAFDGVTTALELESGVPDIARFVKGREGKALIHFGAATSHAAARFNAWNLPLVFGGVGADAAVVSPSGPATNDAASPERLRQMIDFFRAQINAGAIGIGMGLEYTPGSTRDEIIAISRLMAEHRQTIFIHLRGSSGAPGSRIEPVKELADAAAATGVSVHMMHINSQCQREVAECLAFIDAARTRGLDLTTETYSYGEAMTFLLSAFFDPGWQERRGIAYGDLELPETHERLTRERFDALRARKDPIPVVIHLNPESVVVIALRHPGVMIASDGLRAHPRNAGTFSRVLGRYARDQRVLSLNEAIRKASLLPAMRLEKSAPVMRRKGRLQEGMDADVVVFDASKIQDNATFVDTTKPSTGMHFVFVAGTPVIENGKITQSKPAGRAILSSKEQK